MWHTVNTQWLLPTIDDNNRHEWALHIPGHAHFSCNVFKKKNHDRESEKSIKEVSRRC